MKKYILNAERPFKIYFDHPMLEMYLVLGYGS